MATWYVDYEGGTDANASAGNGDSFATRRKKIDNCVAAAIAPGDTIRVMGSPAATSLGQTATWTGVSRVGGGLGGGSITSSTNATPIVVTVSSSVYTGQQFALGDTVHIASHNTNTNANGTWKVSATDGSTTLTLVNADGTNSVGNGVGSGGFIYRVSPAVVELTTAVAKTIACTGNKGTKTNWTSSASVTCTVNTSDYKEGVESQQIAIAAGFTTGLAAYWATGTLDLSAYQQVSFWVRQTSGTIGAAGATRLRLCTDTAGATPVHDINIPALGALNQWVPVVVDLATNLNSAIQSINFDVVTDNGAQTFLIDNVIACKAASSADSLNLTSLISKDPGDHSYGDGYECWFSVRSINDVRVALDMYPNYGMPNGRGYSGTTETVTTYKRETIKTVAAATAASGVQDMQEAGTSGSLTAYSGGWNRTDMSTQTLETWFDGQNGFGSGVRCRGYTSCDKINFTRYDKGYIDGSATDYTIGRLEVCSSTTAPISCTGSRLTATTISAVCCGGAITPGTAAVVTTIGRADSAAGSGGVSLGAGSYTGTIKQANNNTNGGILNGGNNAYVGTLTTSFNGGGGVTPSTKCVFGSVTANSNSTYGIAGGSSARIVVLGGSTSTNATAGVFDSSGDITLRNFTINEATEVTGNSAYGDGRVYSENHDGTANNVQIFCDGGLISKQSSVVHGSASHAWKFSPTSTNRSQYYPLNLPIAQIAVAASALVTVKAWMRRSNTGLTGKLVCKGGQLAGVASDVSSSITAIPDTWEQITVSCTPSESGVLEIEAQFYGGTTYNGYVSDLEITQA